VVQKVVGKTAVLECGANGNGAKGSGAKGSGADGSAKDDIKGCSVVKKEVFGEKRDTGCYKYR